jgi:hypothetical protein
MLTLLFLELHPLVKAKAALNKLPGQRHAGRVAGFDFLGKEYSGEPTYLAPGGWTNLAELLSRGNAHLYDRRQGKRFPALHAFCCLQRIITVGTRWRSKPSSIRNTEV